MSAGVGETSREPVQRGARYTLPHIQYSWFWEYVRVHQAALLISHNLITQLDLN